MKSKSLDKLKKAGWKVGDSSEFLGLSKRETELVAIKLALSRKAREVSKKR